MPYGKGSKMKKGKMSKESYEKSMPNTQCGGGKYSGDNVAELTSSVNKLSSYVKSKKASH